MAHSFTKYSWIERCGIQIEVVIEGEFSYLGSPGNNWDDPGDGPEHEITSVTTVHAWIELDINLDLTQEEIDRFDRLIFEDADLIDDLRNSEY